MKAEKNKPTPEAGALKLWDQKINEQNKMDAIDLLMGAIQFINGQRQTKPKSNNCDVIEMVANSLSETGIK